MRVVILDAVFRDPGNDLALIQIFLSGYDLRHDVVVAPPESVIFDEWLSEKTTGPIRAAITLAIEAGFQSHASTPSDVCVYVRVEPNDEYAGLNAHLSATAACALLQQPFRILVENDNADMNFFRAFLPVSIRQRFEQFLANHWIEFQHCGGITSLTERVRANRTNHAWRIRAFALFDSDGLIPGQISANASAARSQCEGFVAFHMLTARAIENYLNDIALDSWTRTGSASDRPRNKARFRAFRRFDRGQRSHFNMKRGFDGDVDHDQLATVGNFYASVTPVDHTTLQHGFGRDIAAMYDTDLFPELRNQCFDLAIDAPELSPAYSLLMNLI